MKLIIEDDEGRKTVVPIIREDVEITIGRQEGNTIRLTERNVSRKHAKLIRRTGAVYVEDLNSYNGVKVNGDRIAGNCQVRQGDLIQIGDYDLAVQDEEGARPAPTIQDLPRVEAPRDARRDEEDEDAPESRDETPTPTPAASRSRPSAAPERAPAPAASAKPRYESTSIINTAQLKAAARSRREIVDIPADEAPRLVVVNSEFAGREFACIRSEIKIGRTDDNDVAIDHRSLSRNHCKLVREEEGDEWKVIDLQSSNGIKVNGEPYAECVLHPGDVLELGHLKLKFVGSGEESTRDTGATPIRRSRTPLIAAGAVIAVAGLGVGGWFLTRTPAGEPTKIEDKTAVAKPPEVAKAEPPKAVDPVPTPTTPQVQADPTPAPTPALPPPDPAAVKAFEQGKELLAQGRFAEAERKLGAAKDAAIEGAAEALAQARSEIEAQARLADANRKFAAKDFDGARVDIEAIPADTTAAASAAALEAKIAAAEEKAAAAKQQAVAAAEAKAAVAASKAQAAEERRLKAEEEKRLKAEQAKQAKAAEDERRLKAEEERKAKEAKAAARKEQAANDLTTGRTLVSSQKFAEAIPHLKRALEGDPSLLEVHLYLGICYAKTGNNAKAAWHYEEYVHLRPDDPQSTKARTILKSYYEGSGDKPRYPLD